MDSYMTIILNLALRFGGNGFYLYHIHFASGAAARLQQIKENTAGAPLTTRSTAAYLRHTKHHPVTVRRTITRLTPDHPPPLGHTGLPHHKPHVQGQLSSCPMLHQTPTPLSSWPSQLRHANHPTRKGIHLTPANHRFFSFSTPKSCLSWYSKQSRTPSLAPHLQQLERDFLLLWGTAVSPRRHQPVYRCCPFCRFWGFL